MFQLITCTIIFTVLSSLIVADDPCRFEVSGKGVIDISSLASKDKNAAFADRKPPVTSIYEYSYNPCKPFTEGTTCIKIAVCQVSNDKKFTFILGSQESAKWDAGVGPGTNPSISYSQQDKKVTVELVCSDKTDADFQVVGENPTNNYKFRLTHKCACWNGCHSSGGGGGGGSLPAGAVFIIILLVLAVIYLAVFAIYYRFRHQRTGVDLIAHRTFWVALPMYAKGGATHIFRTVTGKGGQYQSV